ncbi:glycosyltransferase [Motilibacter deserti]|uniref:Glycosyltransferase n=1 Tax=Motilibacter deserti TaxID=2714956 RepID=A0ABX0GUT8_9ACTN|nr:glycosyltransferase [Motilibacter deserti]NHC13427.1 glycosyltransferase [Motilibacter deserti]
MTFVYGVCAGPSDKLERLALPGIRRAAPDGAVLVRRGQRSIHVAYNSILDEAARVPGLEGLVLLHDDTVIEDEELERKLRAALSVPGVAVVGVIGGRNHPEMNWWEGERFGYVRDNQHGVLDHGRGLHDVDTVDGLLLVLSAEAVHSLRFDEQRYLGFHGYDADICAQARARGWRVVVTDLDVFHSNNVASPFGDGLNLEISSITYRLKWRRPGVLQQLRARAWRRMLRAQRWRRARAASV